MSPLLKAFYRDYAAWLEAGAPDGAPFYRGEGLCVEITRWALSSDNGDYTLGLRREMQRQFRSAGLSDTFPFGGANEYAQRHSDETQHENQARIAWVKEHAK